MVVLRIHLILMRIRILDPHWKKIDPDPGHILNKNYFQIFYFIFSLIFILKLDEPVQKCGNFYNLSFFECLDLGLEAKKFLFALFGRYFSPWIRIILQIRIQEAKILRIQQIRILSTGGGGNLTTENKSK